MLIKVVLLLVQFILLKIGQLPLWLIKSLFVIFPTIVGHLFHFHLPHFTLYPLPFTLFRLRRNKGRPRKLPFFSFHLKRFKFYLRRKVPKKTKLAIALGIFLIILYSYTSFIFAAAKELPSPKKLTSADKALTTEFFDRNGKLLYRLYEGRNRTLVNISDLPVFLISATIATEDKNFYSHPGIDPAAIIRAAVFNFKNHSSDSAGLEGASTITQQLIKNSLLTPEKTYVRKIKEAILSLWAERIYTKDQILQMYLNEAPYGGPAWGIEAGAQTYFGKSAKDLSLSQAVFLAGLPASPTQFSPYGTSPELGKVRQKEVLRRMVENKFLSQAQADQAFAEDLHLRPQINDIKAPHFVMYVKDLLSSKYGQRVISQGGLKITTTLDLDLQDDIEKIVSEEIEKLAPLNVKNAASMVTDGKTGQILSMVGSKDYHEKEFGSFNVTLSLRQPGSSIKVATYATAFKQGFTPGNTILDVPVTFKNQWGNSYTPLNYDGKYHGPVSIRTALGSSYNIPAVKMLATVGVDNMIQTARDLGISTFTDPSRYGLSLTLGGGEIRMIDMLSVYGTLSQNGQKNYPTGILKVTDSSGNVLEEYQHSSQDVLQSEIAYLITSILMDNSARAPAFGTNSLLSIPGHQVAVKTGTSDNKRDNWTFGYTPQFVVGVWVGNNDNSPMNPQLTSGITGAAPIWNKIMTKVLTGRKSLAFVRPKGVIEATIDGRKDLAVAGIVPKGLVRVAKKEDTTIFFDTFSSYATPSAITSLQNGVTN